MNHFVLIDAQTRPIGSQSGPRNGGIALLYFYLARSGYLRNTVYRWSHMINNVASALFGYIYVSLWQTVTPVVNHGPGYDRATLVAFAVLGQCLFWITIQMPQGLGIPQSVRTGAIAMEMARPVDYFALVIAREWGNVAYQALYRALPVGLLLGLTVGFPRPASLAASLLTLPSLALAAYVGLMMVYLTGLTSVWTLETRWATWLYAALSNLLAGNWIPANMLPGFLGRVAPYSPFAVQGYYPIRIYLGLTGPDGLWVQLAWAVLLTAYCRWLTARAGHHLVVQGG
ncbi:MAG: ABC transporter permease [Mycobacterium leprae]